MEIASIEPHHHHTDFDIPINPSSHIKTLLLPAANGINNNSKKKKEKKKNNNRSNCISSTAQITVSDIEMIALQAAAAYTSLKDLIPADSTTTTPTSSIISPINRKKDSWREIPIKDPLVQHAAWAYLQPMAPDDHESTTCRSFFHRLRDQYCAIFGCLNDVVLVMLNSWFSLSAGSGIMREEEDSGEEDKS